MKDYNKDINNLCEQAKHYGYNAIVNFTYGQRISYWSFDSVVFGGKERWQIFQ